MGDVPCKQRIIFTSMIAAMWIKETQTHLADPIEIETSHKYFHLFSAKSFTYLKASEVVHKFICLV